jgi:hypothetical protein
LPPSKTSSRDWALLVMVASGAIAVQGYHPATEDAEIYTPGLIKLLHPALFPYNTQFFQSHAGMTLFPNLIADSVRLTHLPLSAALFVWQFLSSILLLWACLRIARLCFAEKFAVWCAVALSASLFALPVAGTALLIVDPYLTTRSFSTPGALLAITALIERKYFSAALWVLLTAAIHPLMALFAISFLTVLILLQRFPMINDTLSQTTGLSAVVFPPVTPEYRQILQTRGYFFLSNWEWYEKLGLFAPFAILFAFARLARRFSLGPMSLFCKSLAIYGAVFTAIALLIKPNGRLERFAEIQPLRFLHLLYILMFLFSGGLIGKFILKNSPWRWALLFLPLCAGMAYAQRQAFPATPHLELPGRASGNPWVQAFDWIRNNTPEDAYFALNPRYMILPGEDQHGFRVIAQRSALADAVKDSGAASMFPPLALPWTEQVNAQNGWERFTREDFFRLRQRFAVNWVVLQQPGVPGLPCPYQNAQLLVCRLD